MEQERLRLLKRQEFLSRKLLRSMPHIGGEIGLSRRSLTTRRQRLSMNRSGYTTPSQGSGIPFVTRRISSVPLTKVQESFVSTLGSVSFCQGDKRSLVNFMMKAFGQFAKVLEKK